ncbi:hypothetical protein E4U27_001731 [Claviceps purpurea]|nr:hypothetical protein E4U27_001731 [Claviceps purpurea]KAG6226756.1 hypothetical protein E4U26_002125 [Claviceps purpurea]
MTSAIEKSVDDLRVWTEQNASRLDKLVEGEGTLGTRLAPTKSADNDRRIGCRLDFGSKFEQDGRTMTQYQLQINSGAKKPTLKALASEDTHATWSYADIPLTTSLRQKASRLRQSRTEKKLTSFSNI